MFIKKLILILIILLTASCEVTENDAGGLPVVKPKDPVVNGEFSLEETAEGILKSKFSEAIFSCDLWFQKGENLNLELDPSQTFTWDLINDFSKNKEFNLVEVIDSIARVDIDANFMSFDVLSVLVSESGDLFKMTYNPLISFGFGYQISEKISEIQTLSNKSNTKRTFKHNDNSIIVIDNKRTLEGELEYIFTYLKCDFSTIEINK